MTLKKGFHQQWKACVVVPVKIEYDNVWWLWVVMLSYVNVRVCFTGEARIWITESRYHCHWLWPIYENLRNQLLGAWQIRYRFIQEIVMLFNKTTKQIWMCQRMSGTRLYTCKTLELATRPSARSLERTWELLVILSLQLHARSFFMHWKNSKSYQVYLTNF